MRTETTYSDIVSIRIERIERGNWHKVYLTDSTGATSTICVFGVHPHDQGRAWDSPYASVAWSFEGTMRDVAATALDAALDA